MTEKQKIQLADIVLSFISEHANREEIPVRVGTLNKKQGLNGFKPAEIGHPVFEFRDRYIIYLESNDGSITVSVPYFKETLRGSININFG